jgi:hypothetical protein
MTHYMLIALALLTASPQTPSGPMGDPASSAAKTRPADPKPENAAETPMQPGYVAPKEAPRFELKEDLRGDARTFAKRLSEILGAEVRLPAKIARTPSLPAGKWTASKALNTVGEQIGGVWKQVFVFQPAGKSAPAPASKLASAGTVSLHRLPTSFVGAARALAAQTGCLLEYPKKVSGRYRLDVEEVPIEKALAELGAQAGLKVQPEIRFTCPEPADPERAFAQQVQDEQRRATEEQQRRNEIINRLEDVTGQSPYDANFSWGSVPDSVWEDLNATPEEIEALQAEIQRENEIAQQPIDEVPPNTDTPVPPPDNGQ